MIKVVVSRVVAEYGLGGVHTYSLTDGTAFIIVVVGIHELTVDVELQVILEERRVQGRADSGTTETGSPDDTILISVAYAETVRHVGQTTGNGDVMVCAECRTVDLFLPIGVGIAQQGCSVRAYAIIISDEITILVGIKYIQCLTLHRNGYITIIGHRSLLTSASLLRGDDDDTVRSSATIDGGGGGILQNGETLDISGVDHRQWVGSTLNTLIIHSQTVDDDQRVVGGIQ